MNKLKIVKNKVDNSEHRDEIIKMILAGESSRKISSYLKEKYDEDISHGAINRYHNQKLKKKVKSKLKKKVKKYQKENHEKTDLLVEEHTDKELIGIKLLDDIIMEADKVILNHDSLRPDPEFGITELDIEKHKLKIKKLGIDAAKVRNDLVTEPLGTVDNPLNLNVFTDEELEEVGALARKLARQ
ncbi:MAG: hypothetical protein LBM96_00755 [Methanobrevibacter sp.]|jgi:hypothetical protein|nr:hypothetical protein [Candidatus Methanoflexus mossambicus]